MYCWMVCTVWPSYLEMRLPASRQQQIHKYCSTVRFQLPGYAPPGQPAAAVDSDVLLFCMTPTTWIYMHLSASHPQLPVHMYCIAALYDPIYLDIRLPAIHLQLSAPHVVLNFVYCMTSATWICASQLSISSSMLQMQCCIVCTVWPQLPGLTPPCYSSAPACSIRCAVLRMLWPQLPRFAPPSYISSNMLHTYSSTTLCVLYDLSYLDLRLPAIHQQLHAPDAVLYCLYCIIGLYLLHCPNR